MSPLGTFLRGGTPRPNAAPGLRISLARRLVETPGAPFVSSEEVFGDVASARDELGLLPAMQGPTVVRVQVEGGTTWEHGALAGDWLIDPDGVERVLRLPVPWWTYNDEAKKWARARPWLEAWETCSDARWMLDLASKIGIDRRLIVLATCACARLAIHLIPAREVTPLLAIETAERWARGDATLDEVRTATEATDTAWENAAGRTPIRGATYAAAACAADTVWGATRAATQAATQAAEHAVHAAAEAAADAGDYDSDLAAFDTIMARGAGFVRREITTLTVLRAVVS